MSTHQEIKRLSEEYGARRITRRQLAQGAAALGLSGAWIAALEKGALAAPAALWSVRAQTDKATTMIVAVAENVDTFDPGFTVGSKTAQTAIQNVFDQLTQYEIVDKKSPDGIPYRTVNTEKILPMLCESWKMDGADMVFTIRDGLTYANGDPIDATTIAEGYKRIFETKAVSSFLLSMGGGITSGAAFSAPDPKTFVTKMSKANTLIPKNNVMHNTSALDPKEVKAHATAADPYALDYFKKNLGTGNGPYRLDSYKPDDSLVLVANEKYYGDPPKFTTVILKVVPDATQRVQLLKKGDVDFATQIPRQEFTGLKSASGIKALSLPSTLVSMLEMNTKLPPFDKKEVRQAAAYATPYKAIIDQVFKGQAQFGKSLVPNGMPTSDFSTNKYDTNTDKAKELLAAAGFPEGKGLPEIKLTFNAGIPEWERIAILMQAALKQIGMNIQLEKLPYATFNEQEQGKKLQMWTDEWISWVNDPYYHMSWLAASTSPSNYPQFANARVDEIITKYTLAENSPERDAASKEAQAIIIDEAPYVFLCQPNWLFYTRDDLDGYVYYNDELPRYYHFSRKAS
jgi:peptide/nickel transport system substrate-binding protein